MSDKTYRIKAAYVTREIAGECLAVPLDAASSAHIIILNPVSKFIWDLLSEERTFDELLKAILAEYSVTEEEATIDLKEFINQLEEKNLV